MSGHDELHPAGTRAEHTPGPWMCEPGSVSNYVCGICAKALEGDKQ